MKSIKKILKWSAAIIGLFLLYVVICLVHGTLTDFQPEEKITLEMVASNQPEIINDSILTFLSWNVGYGGLGAKSNFFYDNGNPFFFSGGKMVRSPQAFVEENIASISQFIRNNLSDFILLQEVDMNSKRSYHINQHDHYLGLLPNYCSSFAPNYCVDRVVIPVCEPWDVMGKMESGLSCYSKYKAQQSIRYQYPSSFGWPDYIFHLDRCMALQRYKTSHSGGKELVVINTHNSAYDTGGKLKQVEMDYFKKIALEEYQKGNYVVVGGDWNQTPPNTPLDVVSKAIGADTDVRYSPPNIAADFMPEGWQWAFDVNVPTNRDMIDLLDYGKTPVTLIDYFLVSPNIKIIKVEGKNLKFAHSDHNPVWMKVQLK